MSKVESICLTVFGVILAGLLFATWMFNWHLTKNADKFRYHQQRLMYVACIEKGYQPAACGDSNNL